MSSSIDTAAIAIAKNLEDTESLLLKAYGNKFDGPNGQADLEELATNLGLDIKDKSFDLTVRGLQLVAEQRYQQKSQTFSLFSNILSKADQLKQQILQLIGR